MDATMPTNKEFDVVQFLMDYECGNITMEETIEGFQRLIDSGLIWKLQGSYGRMARHLLASGSCVMPKKES